MKEISLLWRWRLQWWWHLVCQQMARNKKLAIGWTQEKVKLQSGNV